MKLILPCHKVVLMMLVLDYFDDVSIVIMLVLSFVSLALDNVKAP